MKRLILIAALLIFLFCGTAFSLDQTKEALEDSPADSVRSLKGVIIKVESAGEFVLWTQEGLYPFSLYGVALPDAATPQGFAAKKKASDLIFNKLLFVHLMKSDSDKPPGIVVVRGECLNETLVKTGVARVAEECNTEGYCEQWREAEQKARVEKTGFWGDGD